MYFETRLNEDQGFRLRLLSEPGQVKTVDVPGTSVAVEFNDKNQAVGLRIKDYNEVHPDLIQRFGDEEFARELGDSLW